jgi:hypothetical protein
MVNSFLLLIINVHHIPIISYVYIIICIYIMSPIITVCPQYITISWLIVLPSIYHLYITYFWLDSPPIYHPSCTPPHVNSHLLIIIHHFRGLNSPYLPTVHEIPQNCWLLICCWLWTRCSNSLFFGAIPIVINFTFFNHV